MVEKEKVIESIEELYNDLDNCVTNLLKARLEKNTEAEGKALFTMEGLMVASQQELSFLHDYFQDKQESQGLDEAAKEYTYGDLSEEERKKVECVADSLIDAFKAGAKWMESQFECLGTYPIMDERGGYWPSEPYYRKKEEEQL